MCRDICNVERRGEWQISFFVRGCSYGHVTEMNSLNGVRTEEEAFVVACEALNVEYIPPDEGEYKAIFESDVAEMNFNDILEARQEFVIDLKCLKVETLGVSIEPVCKLIVDIYKAIPDNEKGCVIFIGKKEQAEKLLSNASEFRLKMSENPSLSQLI